MTGTKCQIDSVSVIIPVYKGANTIEELVERLIQTLDSRILYKIILSVDGSPDDSYQVCCQLADGNPNVIALELTRNFGQQNAKLAGLEFVDSDVVVFMDDDLQNPPESIFSLIDAIRDGHDAVYTYSGEKAQSKFKNFGSMVNNCMAEFLLHKPKGLRFSSYQAISRPLADVLKRNSNPFPYPSAVLLQATTKIAQVQVPHLPRRDSVSNYSFRKLFALWLNGFIGFSVRPLRVASLIGVLVFLISAISSIVLLTRKIVHPEVIMSGWTSLMLVLLALFGLQFLLLGVIGEYIGRVLLFLNGKPQYVVRRTHASDVNRKEAREARQ